MGKKVLVADDAKFMRMMLRDILIKDGFDVCAEAENGQEAINKYKATKPDLVILDITMPEVNGLQALKSIKEYDPDANCIMCSAMGQQATVMEALKVGAKDFVLKPFQPERVREAVVKAVS